MDSISFKPIGIIYSPNRSAQGTPIQPTAAKNIQGIVEVYPEYSQGLKDLDGFSHTILLYYFHLSKAPSLIVKPYMDDEKRGVFATRAPSRPNPIGLSVVEIEKIEINRIHIRNVDIIDGTPLLDIKPYVPEFDVADVKKIGWLRSNMSKLTNVKDDGRFVES